MPSHFFIMGETLLESVCYLLYGSKLMFGGAFPWTLMGAEFGRSTLNNEEFSF